MYQQIFKIQNRILDLAPNKSGAYLEYCCSEISRLIIKWFADYDNSYEFYILKGTGVLNGELTHDILVIKDKDRFLIIDPTIWQFFPNAKTILVYDGNSLEEGIEKIKQKYKCEWVLGSQEELPDTKTQRKYLEIIRQNIKENIEEANITKIKQTGF